jgi:N6-L-threonylcarbamoyladenine synthase
MYILGCDTSCDDTAIGIIKAENNNYEILSNIRISHMKSNDFFNGVVPEASSRNHLNLIDYVLKESLEKANLKIEDIDYFAVTKGPGLVGCLMIGYTYINTLASILNKPCYFLDHLISHASVVSIPEDHLILIISGGHTMLLSYIDEKYDLICNTVDDAAGEVIDKIGRKMNFSIPAGRELELCAQNSSRKDFKVITPGQMKFSFSGLKTHCLNQLNDSMEHEHVAAFLQESIGKHLYEKISLAKEKLYLNKLVVCGGVACNSRIREILSTNIECFFAPLDLCTDNGIMVAINAYKNHILKNLPAEFIDVTPYNVFLN